jgi:hypothetical protein
VPPSFVHRITKYDPADRDEHGHYTGAEEAVSDHGLVEAAYLAAIAAFAEASGIDRLEIREPVTAATATAAKGAAEAVPAHSCPSPWQKSDGSWQCPVPHRHTSGTPPHAELVLVATPSPGNRTTLPLPPPRRWRLRTSAPTPRQPN